MITLETNVPDQYISKVLEMLNAFSDNEIKISVGPHPSQVSTNYKFVGKKQGESDIEHGERFIKEFMLACLDIIEVSRVELLYSQAVKNINIVKEDVPEDSIG